MQNKIKSPTKPAVIPEYPGYTVDPITREIQNTETGTIVKTNGKGQKKVNLLHASGKRKLVLVSRIMGKTFLPNPKNHPNVLHMNGDTLDDSLQNLKWGTQRDVLVKTIRLRNNRHRA
jgi:hypothetical protein